MKWLKKWIMGDSSKVVYGNRYVLSGDDVGKTVEYHVKAGENVVIIPRKGFSSGDTVTVVMIGDGILKIKAEDGVMVEDGDNNSFEGNGSFVGFYKASTGMWMVVGDLSSVK